MHAGLARDLGVEGDHEHVVLARGDGMALDRGQDLDAGAVLGQPRRADEDGAHRRPVDARDVEVLLEGADLAPERVALAQRVHAAEVLAVEHDHPGARAEHRARRSARTRGADRRAPRARCRASSSSTRRPASPARRAPRGRRARGPRAPRRRGPATSSRVLRSRPGGRGRRSPAYQPGWRAAALLRACATRATASPCPALRRPKPRGPRPGSAWWPRRSPRRASPGPRT